MVSEIKSMAKYMLAKQQMPNNDSVGTYKIGELKWQESVLTVEHIILCVAPEM